MSESNNRQEQVGDDADAEIRETLSELGDRARGIVEELVRNAALRREAASATPGPSAECWPAGGAAGGELPPSFHRRIEELRAGVGEVADVLEATVERLETLEEQLGDPDLGVEKQLRDGIERCERVLDGIEHRVRQASEQARSQQEPGERRRSSRPVVLVVAASSRRRAALCIALEQQGLHTLAAIDLRQSLSLSRRHEIAAALLVLDRDAVQQGVLLEGWRELEERGELPRAAVIDGAGGDFDARGFGYRSIDTNLGNAAIAAALLKLGEPVDDGNTNS